MKKLANISNFEDLQAHANRITGMVSGMAIFNFDDERADSGFASVPTSASEPGDDEWDEEEEDEGLGERPPKFDRKKQKELQDEWDVHSYLDVMEKSHYASADFMGKRIWDKFGDGVELVSGRLDPGDEVYQWYIIDDPWFIKAHTYEPLFYDEEFDVYILGVTNFGTHRGYLEPPQLK